MDTDTPGMAGGCSTRTFTCTGTNPVIEVCHWFCFHQPLSRFASFTVEIQVRRIRIRFLILHYLSIIRKLIKRFFCLYLNPRLQINGGASMVTNAATATLVATCNAAGTAWESNGAPVTEVSCNIRTCSLSCLQHTSMRVSHVQLDRSIVLN